MPDPKILPFPPPYAPTIDPDMGIRCLGYADQKYYLMGTITQQVHVYKAAELLHQPALCELRPESEWVAEARGRPDWAKEGSTLMTACQRAGVFDPRERIRGPGVWTDGPARVVHLGDRVLVDGKEADPGRLRSRWVYARGKAVPLAQSAQTGTGTASERVLAYLLGVWRDVQVDDRMIQRTIKQLVDIASGDVADSTIAPQIAARALAADGIRVTEESGQPGLLLSNRSPALDRLMRRGPMPQGYMRAFKATPGAFTWPKTVRFAGAQTRATFVHLASEDPGR